MGGLCILTLPWDDCRPQAPSLTGSRGTELGVVSGRRCLTEWLRGPWRLRALRSRGWLSQELRVALWDGPAGMSPLRSGGCLGSSEEAQQGTGSLQRALPSPTEGGRLVQGAAQPGP